MPAKSKKKKLSAFQQDDVFRSQHVLDAVLSPDGRVAVYQLCETVTDKEERQAHSLWRVELDSGHTRRLTPTSSDALSPVFEPDGGSVLFLSARDPQAPVPQIYRLPLDGGEAEAITSLPQGVGAFALSPDGKHIAYAALVAPPAPRGPNDHVRIDRVAYRFDPVPGYLQDMPQALFLIPSKGGKPKALTEPGGVIMAMAWSPDGKELAFARLAASEGSIFEGELCVVNRKGQCKTLLADTMIGLLFWAGDGSQVGFACPPGSDLSRQAQLFVVDRKGGKPRARSRKLDLPIGGLIQINSPGGLSQGGPQPAPDGRSVLVPVARGGEVEIARAALGGAERIECVVGGPRVCKPCDQVGSQLLFTSQSLNTPSELCVIDLETEEERQLTHHNASWQAKVRWPEVEHLRVRVARGVEVEGWVLKPKHVRPPYKTVLYIHGGPHAGFGWSYNEDFQELVGAGYAVAFANPRGSTGYGDDFSRSIVGNWGPPELKDFNAFLDELVARGIAHPDRLGVTGVSGGGHLSAWLIGHTDRFAAAVPEQGVYNMFSMYGVSDAGPVLIDLEMGGPPHKQVQRYWELSPIAHAHKCKTPTLLIQGENDLRCPMEQAEQLFVVLKINGCEAELLRLQACNHALEIMGPPALRRFRMDAMKDWFARHIK